MKGLWIGKWTTFQKILSMILFFGVLGFLLIAILRIGADYIELLLAYGIIIIFLGLLLLYSLWRSKVYDDAKVISYVLYHGLGTRLIVIPIAIILFAVLFALDIDRIIGDIGVFLIVIVATLLIFGIREYFRNE